MNKGDPSAFSTMVASGNPRVKRKNVSTETKAEPAKKALKKNDILLQLKALQAKYEVLEEENNILLQEKKNNIESILLLEETVKLLEKSSKLEQKSATVQTEIIRCEECEFPAENIHDLVYHMHEFHPLESESDIKCHYCGENFQTKRDLMSHRKTTHIEKVKLCSYFGEGKCNFGDECWYNHSISGSNNDNTELKCRICDKMFVNRNDFMHHRKKEHTKNVPFCKNALKGSCHFGVKNCWFNHNENDISNINENGSGENLNDMNQEMIGKLFEMMEKFTQRIVQIENII